MRKILTLATVLALAACSGGGGSTTPVSPAQPTAAPATAAPQGNLVAPLFTFTFPPGSTSQARQPRRISPSARSVTIVLTSVNGSAPTVTPTSVSAAISQGSCPCTVAGPAAPPGVPDTYVLTTYDTASTPNALDTATVTTTPVANTANSVSVTLAGIPKTISLTGIPASANAGSTTSPALTVTAQDADMNTITGTYSTPITVSDPDTSANGTCVGAAAGTCAGGAATSVSVPSSTSSAFFNYGGLAENPVTLSASASGATGQSATFTPVLQPIVHQAGPNSTVAGNPVGIDLFSTTPSSGIGYSGVESYSEVGYTNSPYNMVLTTIDGSSCAAFATLAAAANGGNTNFTATAISTATAGSCTRVVSDGLAASGHGTGGPQFVVTFETATISASSKNRHR